MSCTLDLTEFNRILKSAATETFERLGEAFSDELTEEVREYPRETIRKIGAGQTGKVAGSPRDVVDTSELVDSYKLKVRNGLYDITANYSYDSDHAIFVYLGWTSKLGTEVPPYPWILNALKNIDITDVFVEEWDANS